MKMPEIVNAVTTMGSIDFEPLSDYFRRHGLTLTEVGHEQSIPGSFWGDPEAGLIADKLFYRRDTPVHSVLHEGSHFVCMPAHRRETLHTNAGSDNDEESAVCYLQILIASDTGVPGFEQILRDMDNWGYSFRLGCTQRWFEEDAQDARDWLFERSIIREKTNQLPVPV
ncbi:MAG: hypothetical protein AAF434_10440 [Pseudomonadota bacterium]